MRRAVFWVVTTVPRLMSQKRDRSHWLRMLENDVPGKIIKRTTVEVTMHKEELYDL